MAEVEQPKNEDVGNVDVEKEEVEGEDAPVASSEKKDVEEGGGNSGNDNNNDDDEVDNNLLMSITGTFLSAVVLLISVLSDTGPTKNTGYWAYGIALSCVTIFFAFVGMAMTRKPDLVGDRPQISHHLNHFLFVWNFVGACFMTFGDGPFVSTNNGYFASWGMALFSIKALGGSSLWVKNAGPMMGHLAAAIVVIVAIAAEGFEVNKGETIYGIVLAGCSALTVMFQTFMERKEHAGLGALKWPTFLVLAICWVVSACLLTFRGPFADTSNGYFGAWSGAITGMYAYVVARAEAN